MTETTASKTEKMMRALQLLNIPVSMRGDETNLVCPCCSGKKAYANPAKGLFYCHSCSQSGDGVALYYAATRKGTQESITPRLYAELCEEMGFGKDQQAREFLRPLRPQLAVPAPTEPEEASLQDRDRAYRAMLDRLELTDKDRDHLLTVRGLSEKAIEHYMFRSIRTVEPGLAQTLRKQGIRLEGVPGFYQVSDVQWALNTQYKGILCPKFLLGPNGERLISDFQIRTERQGAKYLPLTSTGKKGGTQASVHYTFLGYAEEEVIITEGVLKADIVNYYTDRPVIGMPGVSSRKLLPEILEPLRKQGVKSFCIAFDMDLYEKEQVMNAYTKLKEDLNGYGFQVRRMPAWDKAYKGYDDLLIARGQPKRERYL